MNFHEDADDVNTFGEGAKYAVQFEFLGMISKNSYIDGHNGRLTEVNHNEMVFVKIHGETLKYAAIQNWCGGSGAALAAGYVCIYADTCAGHLFELWVHESKGQPPFIRVDGKIVAISNSIPFSIDHPLVQGHKNESCIGGEVFFSDNFVPPHMYSIKDLLDNWGNGATNCSTKYLTSYNPKLYEVNSEAPIDHPVFIDIAPIQPAGTIAIGSDGLPSGSYQYAFCFVDAKGTETGYSEETPPIPVPDEIDQATIKSIYPKHKTYGAPPSKNTGNGIHFRLRVVNLRDYTSIKIRRTKFIGGVPLGSLGEEELIHQQIILAQEIKVYDFFDLGANGTPLTKEEQNNQIQYIKTARTLRYFGSRLWLGNLTFESRDVEGLGFTTISDDIFIPAVSNMGIDGHKDIHNQVYKKSYAHGERYGFGVRLRDGYGGTSFVKRITGSAAHYNSVAGETGNKYENFVMPCRRDPIEVAGSLMNTGSDIQAEKFNFTGVDSVFEVFGQSTYRKKLNVCDYKNIGDFSHRAGVDSDYPDVIAGHVNEFCSSGQDQNGGHSYQSTLGVLTRIWAEYRPFRGVQDVDKSVTGQDVPTVLKTNPDSGFPATETAYNPTGFAPTYNALGIRVGGIDMTTIPKWAKAATFMRTPRAGRVITEGMAMYCLEQAQLQWDSVAGLFDYITRTTKASNKVWFFSPDIAAGLISNEFIQENFADLKVQFQAGYGFFSEVYNVRNGTINIDKKTANDYNIDMISMLRILFEDGSINSFDDATIGEGNGYISQRKWRNTTYSAQWDAGTKGNQKWTIAERPTLRSNATNLTKWLELFFTQDVYHNPTTANDQYSLDPGIKNFHEPMFAASIINPNAATDFNSNQQKFYPTSTYLKFDSIIGRGAPDALLPATLYQEFLLVDERWEDCITTVDAEDKFIYIEDSINVVKRCVNITNKTAPHIATIIANIISNTGLYAGCIGVYRQICYDKNMNVVTDPTVARYFKIYFSTTGAVAGTEAYYKLTPLNVVHVYYDGNWPINVFGGDVVLGESVVAPIDNIVDDEGEDDADFHHTTQFNMAIAWPFFRFRLNPRIYIVNKTSGANLIQDNEQMRMGFIRQLLMMWTSETRSNVPLMFNRDYPNRSFPLQEYVMRPNKWDADKIIYDHANNSIYRAYVDDFPEEADSDNKPRLWRYGGFRHIMNDTTHNIDYCHEPENYIGFSTPKVGYKERTVAKTGVICSLERFSQDTISPNLKTFLVLNFREIEDGTGEIAKLWGSLSGSGENLYAITENGVCLMLTNKFIARGAAGAEIGIIASEENIQERIWISKTQGLPGEMWRTFAERGEVAFFLNNESAWRLENNSLDPIGRDYYQSRILNDAIKMIGPTTKVCSVYDSTHSEWWICIKKPYTKLNDTTLKFNLGDFLTIDLEWVLLIGGTSVVLPPASLMDVHSFYLENTTGGNRNIYLPDGVTLFAVIPNNTAYFIYRISPWGDVNWLFTVIENIKRDTRADKDRSAVFVYKDKADKKEGKWIGWFDYNFDKLVCQNGIVYGMQYQGADFELNKGALINGEAVDCWVTAATNGGGGLQSKSKEFWGVRANTNKVKPTSIKFFDTIAQDRGSQHTAVMDLATFSTLYLKNNHGGFENLVPSRIVSPHIRIQGTTFIFRISHKDANVPEFVLISCEIFLKMIK